MHHAVLLVSCVTGIVNSFHVYVGTVFSVPFFHVKCGVRQGGILSPFLFTVYVDELIEPLSISGFECYIGDIGDSCLGV